MSNEFRTLEGACSTLVPQGPGYENATVENQVCTSVGSLPAQAFVNGRRFIKLSYSFDWSNTWMVSLNIFMLHGVKWLTSMTELRYHYRIWRRIFGRSPHIHWIQYFHCSCELGRPFQARLQETIIPQRWRNWRCHRITTWGGKSGGKSCSHDIESGHFFLAASQVFCSHFWSRWQGVVRWCIGLCCTR